MPGTGERWQSTRLTGSALAAGHQHPRRRLPDCDTNSYANGANGDYNNSKTYSNTQVASDAAPPPDATRIIVASIWFPLPKGVEDFTMDPVRPRPFRAS